jgi:hypothetical protein
MPLTRNFKIIVSPVIGLVLASAAGYLYWRFALRPLRFDPQRWVAAQSLSDTMRYRMSDDLLKRLTSEQWSLDRTLKELGEPESSVGWQPGERERGARLAYLLGKKPPSLLNGAFYLMLNFDENGRLFYSRVVPQ